MAELLLEMCRKVIEKYRERIEVCKMFREVHLNDIMFHV